MDSSGSQITDCHLAQNQDYSNTSLVIRWPYHVYIIVVQAIKTDEAAHLC